MKKTIVCILMISISAFAFATMTSVTINIPAGQTRDIAQDVPWPAEIAIAHLSPAASANGEITELVGFCQNSKVEVVGPTTVTIEYGNPDLPLPVEGGEASTPDAIGGGE